MFQMRRLFSWATAALVAIAAVVYLAGSSTVDFVGFREWTKGLGNGAGIALAILFLIGGVFSQIYLGPSNRRKPEE